jgi:hypothetical protein
VRGYDKQSGDALQREQVADHLAALNTAPGEAYARLRTDAGDWPGDTTAAEHRRRGRYFFLTTTTCWPGGFGQSWRLSAFGG